MTERHRLLLVDDDVQLTQFLGARLRRDGFVVSVAASGAEALASIDESWPDLVLLDLTMPGTSGEEVAAGIKKRADIPIVVLSAVATSRSKTELIEHYAEDYVTKPFDYPELVARLNRVLRRLNERIPSELLELGPDLSLALRRREAIVAGRPVALSPTETASWPRWPPIWGRRSRPNTCWRASGATPTAPTLPTSGWRSVACGARSKSTRMTRDTS